MNETSSANTNKSFSISEALSFGWNTFKTNSPLLLGLTVIYLLVSMASGFLNPVTFGLASIAVGTVLAMGWVTIGLRFIDGKKVSLDNLFTTYHPFLSFFLASLIFGVTVGIGTILLIVPGIYFAIALSQFPFLVVEKGLGPVQSLKASAQLTKDVKWELLGFMITVGVANFVGFLLFGVGLLVTTPITYLATAHVYRRLYAQTTLTDTSATPAASNPVIDTPKN